MWVAQIPRPSVPLASLHKLLYGYFPHVPDGSPRPFVFRIEPDSIILGSPYRPRCDAIEVIAEQGKSYQFDAFLKPMNGAGRCPIVGNENRRRWMARNIAGASLGFCEIYDMPNIKTHKSDGRYLSMPVCRAIGVLTVTDPTAFDGFLSRGGPGTGKVYGLGMWILPELMGVSIAHRNPLDHR